MIINGKKFDREFKTINEIIKYLNVDPKTVAVTIDLDIVEPDKYGASLNGDETIDIITFVSGG